MPTFAYKALDAEGKPVAGTEEAPSELALTQALESRHLFLCKAKVQGASSRRSYHGGINRRELINFTDQIIIIVRAGVPLLTGLEEIAAEMKHPGFKQVITDVVHQISEGSSLAKAMAAYPKVFDDAYVSVVAAGEEMGGLDIVLEKLTAQMEWTLDTKKQVTGAMIQPAFLLVAVIGLTILVVGSLVPKITDLFSRSGKELPGVTQVLVDVSHFIQARWFVVVGAIGAVIVSYVVSLRFPRGRYFFDRIKLKIPVVGKVLSLFANSRFVNLFGVLYQAGVTVDRNLEIVSTTTGSAVMNRAVKDMRAAIMEGMPMSTAAKSTGLFPSLVVRMLSIGEQSGQIPEALKKVGIFYDKEIPRALKRVLTVLNPVIMMISAAVVAFVVFAAFMPIVKLVSGGGH